MQAVSNRFFFNLWGRPMYDDDDDDMSHAQFLLSIRALKQQMSKYRYMYCMYLGVGLYRPVWQ